MAALPKNAISDAVRVRNRPKFGIIRDRAKQTTIWDHKGYKSQITNIFKIQNGRLEQKFLSRKQFGTLKTGIGRLSQ